MWHNMTYAKKLIVGHVQWMLSQGQDEPINYDAAKFFTFDDQFLEQNLFQTNSG